MSAAGQGARIEAHQRWAPAATILFLLLIAVLLTVFQMASQAPADAGPQLSIPASELAVYFTLPAEPGAGTGRGGPDSALVAAVDLGVDSIDVAVYRLDLWSLRDALLRARQRELRVRVVVETDHVLEPEIQDLVRAGIEVHGDGRESLMHHKFTVIDGRQVWTGSMNYTFSDAYWNDNNLVRIDSVQLAESYTAEFEEMFVAGLYGPLSHADTPYSRMAVDGTPLEVYFSPDDGVASRILHHLEKAQATVEVMAFSLTSDEIGRALTALHRRGVRVRVLVDAGQASGSGSEAQRLRQAGVDVRLDGGPGKMHHKVIIIDGQVLLTGSYNFSRSAEVFNDENLLVIHSREIASAYQVEFDRLLEQATTDWDLQ
jgi:phosphatidylserine/phosphatidylglycerophosphate/cardiolipin synthase-like enzyme